MPRIVRRQSTYQRITSSLNPLDHLLRLATDYEAFDWDNWQNTWGTPLGILLNMFCMIARGQADKYRRVGVDDVFQRPSGQAPSIATGLSYFLWTASWALAAVSVGNAIYCFSRKKRYRLFESNIEVKPATPSARRVRVDSSPISSSPLRVLNAISETFRVNPAERAHPDETRDVWEVSVWDPSQISLHLLAIFSPVHVAIYFLSLPIASNPLATGRGHSTSPAAVYFTVILTQLLLSIQIIALKSWFIQQQYDHRLIHKEVLHEYDQKYVHPRLNVIKRDVAVQCGGDEMEQDDVQAYTPQINRAGFRTFANPNYRDLTVMNPNPAQQQQQRVARSQAYYPRTPFASPAPGSSTMRSSEGRSIGRHSVATNTSESEFPSKAYSNRRGTFGGEHAGYDQPFRPRMGVEALVDWSRANSRSLSPSKARTPLKGSNIRGSSYAESLGTQLGTPVSKRRIP